MKVLKSRNWPNWIFLLLVTGLLSSCYRTETILRDYAEDLVSALDVDIVEEKHKITIALLHADVPASYITSTYVVSDSPEEIKEKLRALHLAEEGWLAPSKDGWIGKIPLDPDAQSPVKFERDHKFLLLARFESGKLTRRMEDLPRIEFFLICPWWGGPRRPDGSVRYYKVDYANVVALTDEGKLVSRIYDGVRWPELCVSQDR